MDAPEHPAGPYIAEKFPGRERRLEHIGVIADAPNKLRNEVDCLSATQLDTRYRNWTIRQITHHLADSHVNAYIRFKWALTEEKPTIKAYEEADWVALADSHAGAIAPPLALLEGLHRRWVQLFQVMTEEQFLREYFHPQSKQFVSLGEALGSYSWHCRHHIAQIHWLRQNHKW